MQLRDILNQFGGHQHCMKENNVNLEFREAVEQIVE
jgi:hypothetical protein